MKLLSKSFEKDSDNYKEKLVSLLKFISDRSYDVICLQDFPMESYANDSFLRSMKQGGYYKTKTISENSYSGKFNHVIFSRERPANTTSCLFHRDEELLTMTLPNTSYILASVKFDPELKILRKQIKNLSKYFPDDSNVILCCDSNIREHYLIKNFPDGWKDSWKEFGISEDKFTFEQERPDRIYVRGVNDGLLRTASIEHFDRKGLEFQVK
jgi:exonuclease III